MYNYLVLLASLRCLLGSVGAVLWCDGRRRPRTSRSTACSWLAAIAVHRLHSSHQPSPSKEATPCRKKPRPLHPKPNRSKPHLLRPSLQGCQDRSDQASPEGPQGQVAQGNRGTADRIGSPDTAGQVSNVKSLLASKRRRRPHPPPEPSCCPRRRPRMPCRWLCCRRRRNWRQEFGRIKEARPR